MTSLSLLVCGHARPDLGTGPLSRLRQLVRCAHAARSTTATGVAAPSSCTAARWRARPLQRRWPPCSPRCHCVGRASPNGAPPDAGHAADVALFAWLLAYGWLFVAVPGWLPRPELPRAPGVRPEVFDDLPRTPTPLRRDQQLLLMAAGLAVALHGASRGLGVLGARTCCAACAVVLAPWSTSRRAWLVVLDVGHGTAAALRAPDLSLVVRLRLRRSHARGRRRFAPLLAAWEARELDRGLAPTATIPQAPPG